MFATTRWARNVLRRSAEVPESVAHLRALLKSAERYAPETVARIRARLARAEREEASR